MSLIFRNKKESDDAARKKEPETSSRERMIVAGIITVVLVAVAGLVVVTSGGGGTPLTRCTGIALSQQRSSCLFGLANSTENVSVCGYLPTGQSSQCISNIAVATKNVSTCGTQSANTSSYSTCIVAVSEVNPNISYCTALAEPYKSECAYGVATQQNFMQSASCSIIGNQTLSSDCKYRNDYQNAISYKSLAYCSELPAAQNASLIAYMFAQTPVATGLANTTALLPFLSVSPSQFCSYDIAVLTYNSSICSGLNGTISLLCNTAFSGGTYSESSNITLENVSTTCAKLPSYLQQVCGYGLYSYIAVKNRNVSICGQIGVAQYQNACYSALAAKYKDDQYCTLISNSSVMGACESGASASNSTG